jgi:hypothetical protein
MLPEDKARECLADVPVLPPGEDERQVACFHVDEWDRAARAAPDGVRDESEVTT